MLCGFSFACLSLIWLGLFVWGGVGCVYFVLFVCFCLMIANAVTLLGSSLSLSSVPEEQKGLQRKGITVP